MNDNEFKNFRNFIELKLRDCFDNFERDFIKWSSDSFADLIARELHREYQIKQKWDESRFLVVPENERAPCCHGCENEFGDCGTPCVNCSSIEKFNREWKNIMWVPNKFSLYERITV